PGFHVFSKFVKLPPVDTSKVTQIIQYEAQQNVPFPLEEVVWDYQILGTTPTGELEVLLVAIKADVVEGLFRTAEAAGLRVQLVDVSPAGLCNAFRYNYGDLDGCTMLLDVGAPGHDALAHSGQPNASVLSRAAGWFGPATLVPRRRRVDHAVHRAVLRGKTQSAGRILQSFPQRPDRSLHRPGRTGQSRPFLWRSGGLG